MHVPKKSLTSFALCLLVLGLCDPGATCGSEPAVQTNGSWITFLSHRSGENLLYKSSR